MTTLLGALGVQDIRNVPRSHAVLFRPFHTIHDTPPLVQIPTTVTVTPSPVIVSTGTPTRQLHAVLRDQEGIPIEGATFSWDTSDPLVATIDASGLVTRVATGLCSIVATYSGILGSVESSPIPVESGDVVVTTIGMDGPPVFEEIDGGGSVNLFSTQFTPSMTVRAFPRNAALEIVRNAELEWHVDPQGGTFGPVTVTPNGATAAVTWDETMGNEDFAINEDGILVNVTHGMGESTVSSGVFAIFTYGFEFSSYNITSNVASINEGNYAIITAHCFDQFNNPIPAAVMTGGFTWMCDPALCVAFHPPGVGGEPDNGCNPVGAYWAQPALGEIFAFTDIGEPPVETESNHIPLTLAS